MKAYPLIFAAFAVSSVFAEEVILETKFNRPDFEIGELPEGGPWRSTGTTPARVIAGDSVTMHPGLDGQALMLERIDTKGVPSARAIFVPLAKAVTEPFRVSLDVGCQVRSRFPVFEILVGDSTTGSKGVFTGITFSKEQKGKLFVFAYDGNDQRVLGLDHPSADEIQPGEVYRFEISVDPANGKYDLTVLQGNKVIVHVAGYRARNEIAAFNALSVRIAGGAEGDGMVVDNIRVVYP